MKRALFAARRVGATLLLLAATGSAGAHARDAASQALQPARSTEAGDPRQRGFVVLFPEDLTRPWVRELMEGLRQVILESPNPPALYYETLDTARFSDPEYHVEFRDWLTRKYARRRIDLVLALGEDSLGFLSARLGGPWPGVPVVYAEVGDVEPSLLRGLPGATGVIFENHFEAALGVVKTILPGTRQIALVYGSSEAERYRLRFFSEYVRDSGLGLSPLEVGGFTKDTAAAKVGQLPADTVVFIVAPYIDQAGRALAPREGCEIISSAANRPSFIMAVHDVGCGAVGGLLRDFRLFGRELGQRAVARAEGAPPSIARVPMSRYATLVFDERQLRRWRIPENQLPAGSTVLFRRPSLWRDHRTTVVVAAGALLLQTALIGGLIYEQRRRRRAEREARAHLAAMAHLDRRAALGQLTASLTHELNQPLGAILRNAEAAAMLLDRDRPDLGEIRAIVEDIRKDDRRAADVIRRLRTLLHKHPVAAGPVDVNDVAAETVAIAAPEARAKGVRIELALPAEPTVVTGDKVHLQQALLNVVLNGLDAVASMPDDQRRVVVRAARDNGVARLSVTDSGRGIPPDVATRIFEPFFSTKPEGGGMGLGLSIARTIIEAHAGGVEARPNPEGGAIVSFALPISDSGHPPSSR